MKEKREIQKKKVFISLVIAIILFLIGFFLGYVINYSNYQTIILSQESIKYSLLSIEVEKELLSESCENFNPSLEDSELTKIREKISIMEENLGKSNKKVIEQKKYYSLLQVKHFLLIKEYNKKCSEKYPTLIFFYSNKEEYLFEAERIGRTITAIKSSNENLMVYSFDYDLDISALRTIKNMYGIENPNVVIVNEEIRLTNLKNINELREALTE
jgi:hypothetical protein